MELYKTSTRGKLIKHVECERETESNVWINGRRYGKTAGGDRYFDTFNEAKAYLMKIAEEDVEKAKSRLSRAKDHLENVRGLKG